MAFDFNKITASDVIAALSLIVAILSLLINIVPLLRDRARIDFSLYLADGGHFVGNKFVKTEESYALRVVNSGRRPVTITHVGGVTGEVGLLHYWFWRLSGFNPPTMFFINHPGINTLLRTKDGNDRTLAEGEYSFGSLKLDEIESRDGAGLKARQFHVIDSLGRYHRLPFWAHRRFQRSVDKRFAQTDEL